MKDLVEGLVIVRGLPGSGKSTYAEKQTGYVHIEADQFMIDKNGVYVFDRSRLKQNHRDCLKLCELLLLSGHRVIVANTFTRKAEYEPYVRLAETLDLTYKIVVMTGDYDSIHNVPEETIRVMKDRWEE